MESLLTFISGFAIGIIAVLFGGSMFLSIPLFQVLWPGISYGQVIGNIKMGSLFRGVASTHSTWEHLEVKKLLPLLIPFLLSSLLSTAFISKIGQEYLLYAVLMAIVVNELSPILAKYVSSKTRVLASIFLGLYAGLIGAGISLLLMALIRTLYPSQEQLVHVKIQALFFETVSTLFIVVAHIWYGNILFPLWLLWSAGTLLGGYLGGRFLKGSVRLSGRIQQYYLYAIYAIALLPFLVKYLSA